jgi:transcriptional regulator with PAS, ATPase and Fis domain
LRLNCGAFTEQLLESELFGHQKGAFTGADAHKPGLLETAHGGSVLLDEIGELPARLQVKLLRVLEERRVLPVGAVKPRAIDVRFVAATNRDLEAEIARGAFRRDLYFRLAGATLLIPPLRERVGEIEELALRFLGDAARPAPSLSPAALVLLKRHGWPGNIRELRNVMECAALLATGGVVGPEHLELRAAELPRIAPPPLGLDDERARERERIIDALQECAGNQSRAAKRLGISRSTLVARLDEFRIPRPRR